MLRLPGRSRSFAVAALILCFLVPLAIARGADSPSANQINAIFASVTSPREPGLAVLVRKGGKTVFERGYGLRDLRSGLPIGTRTDFRLASFTKQFTAMAVMLLVHDGKLRYDEHLSDIFPEFPAYGKTITIRNILNHTSGLVAYEDLMDKQYAGKSPEEIPQIHDAGVLALMEQQTGTKFPPGTRWEYSNSGYCVLAMVVEKISGMAFGEFLRRQIFEPLGMSRTLAYEYGRNNVSERAYGYTNDVGVWLETDQSPTSATLGDGGVYTNLEDLTKWDDALRNHTLLSAAEFQAAITPATPQEPANFDGEPKPFSDADGKPVSYGFGWFLDPYRGHERMWHTGSSIGFRTVFERFTSADLTIIILGNRTDQNVESLALKVADLILNPSKSSPSMK
ncbi:MAG TPA: serine hydrolase domain-containing protein [Candidatus Acidoferrales bacterium]|nr:serine hydrolase domain-containing protein [Candidatus Acidoferrales bacterium]